MEPQGSAALFPVWVPSGLEAQLLLEPPEGSAFHTDQGSLPLLAWERQERQNVRQQITESSHTPCVRRCIMHINLLKIY